MKKIMSLLLIALFAFAAMPKAKAQVVTLDYYFNHEFKKDASGNFTAERFHYIWEEKDLNGYSNWGDAFVKYGAKLKSLEVVDPDNKKETPSPNLITRKNAKAVAAWVKAGGVLVILANDSANVNLPSANVLAGAFGLHFNDDIQNHVIGNNIAAGTLITTDGDPIFKTARKIYLKDMSSLTLSGNAKPAYTNSAGTVLMATVKYGKGTVFAVGDPWLYNEYTNGHLPAGYDNDKAIDDLTKWLLAQIPQK
jgi:hypothetical protein